MGLFGVSLNERIRRSASAALPQADWRVDVDWSTGAKMHQLRGSMAAQHSNEETMQFARNVWSALAKEYRVDPDDGRDGLLKVGIKSAGGAEQWTDVRG